MHKSIHFFLPLAIMMMAGSLYGQHPFFSSLDTAQTVPPAVFTTAINPTGTASMVLNADSTELKFYLTITDLSGPIAAAHFHNAALGASGDVMRTITDDFTGNTATGVWKSTDAQPLTKALVDELIAGNIYYNIHTAANGAGELRGQVSEIMDTAFFAMLDTLQANPVPTVSTTNPAGTAIVMLHSAGDVWLDITLDDLSGPITAAHFHNAAAGETGPPVRTLTDDFVGNSASVNWTGSDAEPLTPELIDELILGNIYLNIHTANNGAGEVRGQVTVINPPTVDVTFWFNTATVPDTVSPNSLVQIRGDTAPLTWGDDTVMMEHAEGDLWTRTLQFPAGADVKYKFKVRTDLVQGGQGWEAGFNTGSTNRELTVPGSDTHLPVMFYNTTNGSDPLFRPYVETDSLDVYVRINMHGFVNFNKANQFVGARGGFAPSNWGTNLLLNQEAPGDNSGDFTYPANEFWYGQIKLDPAQVTAGDTIQYKFVTLNNRTIDDVVVNWEDNLDRTAPWVDGGGNRNFRVPTKDTTVVWDFFDDAMPVLATNEDSVDMTFTVDMTRAITSRGFELGDTLFVRAGFSGTANELADVNLFNVEGTNFWSGRDTVIATVGDVIEYDYRIVKFGNEVREAFFDFDFSPEPGEEGRSERRRGAIGSREITTLDNATDEFSSRRQPFFSSQRPLTQDVLVTFEVDMRPAIFELLFSSPTDTLKDIQGNRDVFDPDKVIEYGVRINGLATGGWQAWGGVLNDDLTRTMYDDGTNGDAVAGDSIYTRQYAFSPDSLLIGTMGRAGQVFKFGIQGGDNEGGFGNNHVANVDDSGPTFTVRSQFGSIDPRKYDHWDFNTQTQNPTSVELVGGIPEVFELAQNYPNPFNPETTIRYSIIRNTEVTLTVFNMLGQEVASLVDKNQVRGKYVVSWNGQNDAGLRVASGVYVYKLVAGDFIDTKKMLLLK